MSASTQLEHEQGVIKAFVLQKKQERFLTFLSKSKTRNKLTQELADFRCVPPRIGVDQFPGAYGGLTHSDTGSG